VEGVSLGFSEGALYGGRYRLERVLGAGGMASVWLARDERLGRPIALKLLSDTLIADPEYLTRFRREARLAAALSHPNLVRVYDFGGEEERPYLAMEYVEGETLAHHIAQGTAAAELDPIHLAQGLLAALEHIHGAGITHRDIKPANVMITRESTVKVTDFGIAQPADATRLTSTGLVIGTRSYMAPEVLRGEAATARSDLYSSAIVLEEASGELTAPGLARFTARLGEDDPARRPQSASEALAELAAIDDPTAPTAAIADPTAPTERLLSGVTTVKAPTVGSSTHAQPSPLRWLGAAALLIALALGGISLLSGGGSSPPDDRTDRGTQAPEGGTQDQGPGTSTEQTTPEQNITEETTTGEAPAVAAPSETPEPLPAPGKAKEAKPPKGAKSPPGKAKGLKKH